MIVCPNCLHQNQDGALHCELCAATLPASKSCPNCGASIQLKAKFCGQCGFNLPPHEPIETSAPATAPPIQLPDPAPPDPQLTLTAEEERFSPPPEPVPLINFDNPVSDPLADPPGDAQPVSGKTAPPKTTSPNWANTPNPPTTMQGDPAAQRSATQFQSSQARLCHIQTSTILELPPHLNLIHIGKPNERTPPDLDVAGFPHSEVISRVHAAIRVENGSFFIEDVGSSNGTYVNNIPLLSGNRHRLRAGDRIALGKGDLVTFLFQLD